MSEKKREIASENKKYNTPRLQHTLDRIIIVGYKETEGICPTGRSVVVVVVVAIATEMVVLGNETCIINGTSSWRVEQFSMENTQ